MANVEYLFRELKQKTEHLKKQPNITSDEIKELFAIIEKMGMSTFKSYAKDYLVYRDGVDQMTPRAKFIVDKINLLWKKTLNELLPANEGFKVLIDEFGFDKIFGIVFNLKTGVDETLSIIERNMKDTLKQKEKEEREKAEFEIKNKRNKIKETIKKYNSELVKMAISGNYDIPVLNVSISYLPLKQKDELLQKYPFVVIIDAGTRQEPAFRDDYGEPYYPTQHRRETNYLYVEYSHKYPEFQKEIEKTIDEYRKNLDLDGIIKTYEEIIKFVINNYKK